MWFLFDIEKMDSDEHTLGIIWKVLGMLCILLDLAPFLSLYILLALILILIFVFRFEQFSTYAWRGSPVLHVGTYDSSTMG